MISYRVGLIQYDWYPYKEGEMWTHTGMYMHVCAHTESTMWTQADIRWYACKLRNVKDGQQTTRKGERHGTDSFTQPLKGHILLTAWCWAGTFQNCETLNSVLLGIQFIKFYYCSLSKWTNWASINISCLIGFGKRLLASTF
jgi:hypothetical protein